MMAEFSFAGVKQPNKHAALRAMRVWAETMLGYIYEADHINWHEICLSFKHKAMAWLDSLEEAPTTSESNEAAKNLLAEVLKEFSL